MLYIIILFAVVWYIIKIDNNKKEQRKLREELENIKNKEKEF